MRRQCRKHGQRSRQQNRTRVQGACIRLWVVLADQNTNPRQKNHLHVTLKLTPQKALISGERYQSPLEPSCPERAVVT